MKKSLQMARNMVSEFLGMQIDDIISGNVEDDPGLLEEHEKLMALTRSGQVLTVTTTICVESEDGLSERMEIVCPFSISGSFFGRKGVSS